jgi:hypothetical protein
MASAFELRNVMPSLKALKVWNSRFHAGDGITALAAPRPFERMAVKIIIIILKSVLEKLIY